MIDTTLASENFLHFRENLLERTLELFMTMVDKIRDEKRQYDINREAKKASALSSSKMDQYGQLTGEEILLSDESRMIGQAKFAHYPLCKSFEKQIKIIKDQGRKQVSGITNENKRPVALTNKDELVKGRFDEIRELFDEINLDDFIYYFKGKTDRKKIR